MKIQHYLIAFFVAPLLVSFFTRNVTILGLSILVTLAFFWVTTRDKQSQSISGNEY